jgi:hypothetical protein
MMPRSRTLVWALFALVLAPFQFGCETSVSGGDTNVDRRRVFVGEVTDTDARVSVVWQKPSNPRLYFCGGVDTLPTLTHWFNPLAADAGADAGIVGDGYGYDVSVKNGVATGNLNTPDGVQHAFTAPQIATGGLIGLYEAVAPCGKVGLIVSSTSDGTDVEAQGACTGKNVADARQVNPILPITSNADGSLDVRIEGETETVNVTPAAAF